MLVSEACQLVLQEASNADGGELFVLNMGEPAFPEAYFKDGY